MFKHKRVKIILFTFVGVLLLGKVLVSPGLIAYSRIYIGVHYPLDILCGAMAGIVMATLVYSLVNKRASHLLPPY